MNVSDNSIPNPSSTPNKSCDDDNNPITEECSNCGSRDGWYLHHVRPHRRLCTSCVLRLHPASFCPYCFTFYDSTLPPLSKRLSCTNCSSITHSHCAPSSRFPFLCPPCSDPNFTFFRLNTHITHVSPRVIDKKIATVLLCASRISAASMAKAVILARGEAEKKAKEAAFCKKRAREALEDVAFAFNKEKEKVKKSELLQSVELSGSGNLGKLDGVVVGLPGSVEVLSNNGNANQHLGHFESNGETKPSLENSHVNVSVKEETINNNL